MSASNIPTDLRVEEEVVEKAPEIHPDELYSSQPEAWAEWETRLILYSLAIGIGGLVVLGALINLFLL